MADTELLNKLVFVAAIVVLCVIATTMAILAFRKLHVHKRFGACLCYHKGGGGVLARFSRWP